MPLTPPPLGAVPAHKQTTESMCIERTVVERVVFVLFIVWGLILSIVLSIDCTHD